MARRRGLVRLTARQVNLALELFTVVAVITGLGSWSLTDRWSGPLTFIHGLSGLAITVLMPAKLRGSVRTGYRRGHITRWVSALFGVLVVATVALGFLHATGLWFGVGTWTALWTHLLFGFTTIPFLLWHVATRPIGVRPQRHDLGRRALLRFGAVGAAATGLHLAQRPAAAALGLAGGSRRSTGSHEVASHDPANMPAVIWFDDQRPRNTNAGSWELVVGGTPVRIEALERMSRPVTAVLDCTGGWWSEQAWDAVPLSELLPRSDTLATSRSVRISSATGSTRHFSIDSIDRLYLAVGYGGEPLRPGHGAPVRLVVPGRRGPEWIKWVNRVEVSDRPAWLQAPLPLT